MTARLRVVVTPRSSREQVAGWRGEELWLKVSAPADGGRANAAVCTLLARSVGVPKGAVRVVRGHTSRHKLVAFDGVDDEDVRSAFGTPPKRDR